VWDRPSTIDFSLVGDLALVRLASKREVSFAACRSKLAQVLEKILKTESGLKFRALFAPGHSFDLTIYKVELAGRRVAFTGDLGFENQDILDRCWGDADKARAVVRAVRNNLLSWRPDIVFTGHGVQPNGMEFITKLVERTEESLTKPGCPAIDSGIDAGAAGFATDIVGEKRPAGTAWDMGAYEFQAGAPRGR
jgi:glyoxylase-like metal-dependent hydrolase (beta-lactamase superfamily II)